MLKTIKSLLLINNEEKDELLSTIIELCQAPVLAYIGEVALPPALNYIVIEMAIIRFNRLKSEGLTSESIDGGSVSFIENSFNLYKQDLDNYISNRNANKKGITFY